MALAYTAPIWENDTGEGISASNLQAISNCIEGLVQGSDKAVHAIQINGSAVTLTYADGTEETFTAVDLKSIAQINKTSTSGIVDTYTITYSDGTTSTFTVTNGADGQDGHDGHDGRDGQDGRDGAIQYTAGSGINISINDEISVDTAFSEASTRANISSGDTFATILGKISKFFSDLADLAFIQKDGSTTNFLRGDGTWTAIPVSAPHSGTASASNIRKQRIRVGDTYTDIDNTSYMEATANSASFAFVNGSILDDSAIDVYTDTWGDNPSNVQIVSGGGTCNVTFSSAKTRTVRIYIK